MVHALARFYDEPDKEVLDLEDKHPPPIAMPRVRTEDLTMHVQLLDNGTTFWHRLHTSTTKTSCGIPINLARTIPKARRDIEHPLAPRESGCDCWTREERREADDAYLSKFGRAFTP